MLLNLSPVERLIVIETLSKSLSEPDVNIQNIGKKKLNKDMPHI
ncbi:MAG: hypothetical protein U5K00_17250 [Melioribacteraceae bacterium]|nr:hypothetical protein [Melioribacteraceae bacterium]